MDKFFVNPGSATGAFVNGWAAQDGENPTPSFCLMDVCLRLRLRCELRCAAPSMVKGGSTQLTACSRSKEYHLRSTCTSCGRMTRATRTWRWRRSHTRSQSSRRAAPRHHDATHDAKDSLQRVQIATLIPGIKSIPAFIQILHQSRHVNAVRRDPSSRPVGRSWDRVCCKGSVPCTLNSRTRHGQKSQINIKYLRRLVSQTSSEAQCASPNHVQIPIRHRSQSTVKRPLLRYDTCRHNVGRRSISHYTIMLLLLEEVRFLSPSVADDARRVDVVCRRLDRFCSTASSSLSTWGDELVNS